MVTKKRITLFLTLMLSLFAGITLGVHVMEEFRGAVPIQLPDGLNVLSTHATVRCFACTAMERLTLETLQESFPQEIDEEKIVFRTINYEKPEIAEVAEAFQIATATVILIDVQNGKMIAGKNLTREVWQLYTDEKAFKKMLRAEIDTML